MSFADQSSPSIDHQDRSGAAGAPLAVFVGDNLHSYVPNTDTGYELVRKLWAEKGVYGEVLTVCLHHPTVPAVECTDCVPLDD